MRLIFRDRSLALAFGAALVLATAFALYTNHVWEDYYITFRSSKNLATGHGLVFNHGDRLHTFTSPLGVLAPAAAYLLTGNSSDTVALWIFRMISATAFAGGVALLVGLVRRLEYPALAVAFIATLAVVDAKSLDFTINGMETGFLLLFLAYCLWAHFAPGPRQWMHLGAAWAGLMWSRPDSFIYIGLIGVAVWLFNKPSLTGRNRSQLLSLYMRAGLLTTALYLPWFTWAWWYYGSPIPHTIVAKSGQGGYGAWSRVLENGWRMPWLVWQGRTAVEGSFLPAYYMFPAWPAWMVPWGRFLGTVCCVLWLIPGVRRETRMTSLAFYGGLVYLSFVPYFPFPWYYPVTTLLGILTLGGLVAQLWSGSNRTPIAARPFGPLRMAALAFVAIVVLGSVTLTLGVARQAKAHQHYVETGNRRAIGEWLKTQSKPGDTVFMEPLGYIGYFSGLKTYDWPGMSSREMVNAKPIVGTRWGDLICYLQPTWLVLRPDGEGKLGSLSPLLNMINYEEVREFNQLDAVRAVDVPGRAFLEFDARFTVYRLKSPTRHDTEDLEIASPIGSSIRSIGSREVRLVHAPGFMIMDVPESAHTVSGWFGIPPEAIEGNFRTDGAIFTIHWTDGKVRTKLYERHLNPYDQTADRSLISYRVELPQAAIGARQRVIFGTDPAGSTANDWTCWTKPEFDR